MSRSIHVTLQHLRRLTRQQVDEQASDPHSDLHQWAKKRTLKKQKAVVRRSEKQLKKLKTN